jgi:drug/metabolite transporter (DMT)-like permease
MTPAAQAPTRLQLSAAFCAVYLFWGGTFLAVRYAVVDIPPLLTIGLRCAGGAVVLFAWLAARGELAAGTWAQWRTAAVAGLFLFLGCHGLMAWAEQRVTSGQAALLMTAIPVWMVVLSALIERRAPSARVAMSLMLGIAGVAVLTSGGQWSGELVDQMALSFGALAWAAGSLIGRHGARPASVTQTTAMQLAAGAAWVLAASAVSGELDGWSLAEVTPRAAGALVFLILCGTVLGFGAYTWLLRATTPAAASSYGFVNPVVALALGWLVGDDRITFQVLVAAALVVLAVVLIRQPAAAPSEKPASMTSTARSRSWRSRRRRAAR